MEEDLPPGFRFHPTDEELITHFLLQKVLNIAFSSSTIGEVDLSKCEPWDLPQKAKMGEKEWYFFCQRDRKYPTGMRTNRATEAGYWKATGKDKQIYKSKGCIIGMKKTLVFYKGRAPKGEKTNWVLHEYRLEGNFSYYNLPKFAKDEWVVCRVFQKNNTGVKKSSIPSLWRVNSFGDDFQDFFSSSSYLVDPSYFNSNRPSSSSFIDDEDESQGTRMENQITYFSNEMIEQHQLDHKGSIVSNSSNLSKEMNNSIPTFPNPEYSGQDHAMIRALAATDDTYKVKKQCEVEQFSSTQSMISLSTNIKTKTSLMALEHELRDCLYKDLEGPSSAGAEVDLEYFLDY